MLLTSLFPSACLIHNWCEFTYRACLSLSVSSRFTLLFHPVSSSVFFFLPKDDKTSKIAAVASDGEFWVSKVLASINKLEKDPKHVGILSAVDEDDLNLRQKARSLIERLGQVSVRLDLKGSGDDRRSKS